MAQPGQDDSPVSREAVPRRVGNSWCACRQHRNPWRVSVPQIASGAAAVGAKPPSPAPAGSGRVRMPAQTGTHGERLSQLRRYSSRTATLQLRERSSRPKWPSKRHLDRRYCRAVHHQAIAVIHRRDPGRPPSGVRNSHTSRYFDTAAAKASTAVIDAMLAETGSTTIASARTASLRTFHLRRFGFQAAGFPLPATRSSTSGQRCFRFCRPPQVDSQNASVAAAI